MKKRKSKTVHRPTAKRRAPSRIAKLTIPKRVGAIPRERLFALLDEFAHCPLIWIDGPPGSGKTTLAASYLERSARRVLWYRADAGDADLSTFFYHLREAASSLGSAAAGLSLLSPAYLVDIAAFSRSFFRTLFDLFDGSGVLVIDNYQEAGAGNLDSVIKAAVAELPNQVNVLILSRGAPPPLLATLQLQGALASVHWEALRLTLKEAEAIAANALVTDSALVRSLHSSCDGWVAGLILLLQYAKQVSAPEGEISAHARETLFSYFSSELFATVPQETQRLVLSTAFLPSFTVSQAATFATVDDAEQMVDWLCKRNFFIDYREGTGRIDGRIFQYHALFREFLLERGRTFYTPEQRHDLVQKSAQILESDGQAEEALALHINESLGNASTWNEAARLVITLAPRFLQQGRNLALDQWINKFPEVALNRAPWLRYWLGFARLPFDPAEGRAQLVLAYEQFSSIADQLGRLLACSGILHSFWLEWGDQLGTDRWMEILNELMKRTDIPRSAAVETGIVAALMGVLLRHLNHPLVSQLIERACVLFRQVTNMEQRVMIGSVVVYYFGSAGPLARGQQIIDEINASINIDELSPFTKLQWLGLEIYHSHLSFRIADYGSRVAKLEQAIELTRSASNRIAVILFQGIYLALKAGDLSRTQVYLDKIATSLSPKRPLDRAQFLWVKAAAALLRNDVALAHECAGESLRIAESLSCTFGIAQARMLLVDTRMQLQQYSEARHEADELLKIADHLGTQTLGYAGRLLRSYVLLECGEENQGLDALREALKFGVTTGQASTSPWCSNRIIRQLCEVALRHDIETTQVRTIIESLGLRPRDLDLAAWPWPIRIYTLGRFSVLCGAEPIKFSAKTQKKPLELLRALIARGGRAVHINDMMNILWPAEGPSARVNFDMALMRLRKLLGHPDAITLTEGRLTLDQQVCWVDAWTFERAVTRLNQTEAPQVTALVLEMYHGHFLDREGDVAWIANMRDRLAAKFQRVVLHFGKREEQAERWDAAASIYRQALEQDNLHEEFYRRLMTCQHRLGQRADAIKTYRRCRELLSINLRAKPSTETEALHRKVLAESS